MHLQLHQFLNLLFLFLLASVSAFLYLDWYTIVLLLFYTFLIEHLFIYSKEHRVHYLSFSSLATTMGIMLMMVASEWYIYLVAITLGLMQKHFLRYRGDHFFNPSNFAVVVALFLFYKEAHIVLGQLGDHIGLTVLSSLLGGVILWRAHRWIIPMVFIGAYLLAQYLLVLGFDPVLTMDEITHRFYSVSFIIFILFMLTDPRTTPDTYYQQILFAVIIAVGASLLDRYMGFRVQHLFLVLFFFSLWTPLMTHWNETAFRKKGIILTMILAILAMGVIMVIEMQAPYYFDMNG